MLALMLASSPDEAGPSSSAAAAPQQGGPAHGESAPVEAPNPKPAAGEGVAPTQLDLFQDRPPVPPAQQLRGPPLLPPPTIDGRQAESFLAAGLGQWTVAGLAWGVSLYGLGSTISFWGLGTKNAPLSAAERYPFWVSGEGAGWSRGDYQGAAAVTGLVTLGLMVAGGVLAWYASDNLDRYRELRMWERAEIATRRRQRWEQTGQPAPPAEEAPPAAPEG